MSAILKTTQERRADGAGVTIVDPATRTSARTSRSAPTRSSIRACTSKAARAIGSGCEIHSGVRIVDSTIDDGVVINNFCVITESHVSRRRQVGPFAHIRPQSRRRRGGARRQLRRAEEDDARARARRRITSPTSATRRSARRSTSAPARSPATTTASHKHPTVIEDGAFIGSDSQLIAPVRVGEGAYVAAGSSITEDVPAGALGDRARQAGRTKRAGWRRKQEASA